MMAPAEPWEYAFERQLEKRIKVLTDQLAEGGAKDYVDYVKLCGEIYGIQFSISTLKEVRKRLNTDDDADLRDDQ